MLTLDASKTALVVIDLQEGILPFAGGPHTADDVVSRAARLAEKCRAAAEDWQPVAEQLYAELDPRWQRTFAGVSRAHRLRVKHFDRPLAEKPKED